MTTPIEKVHLNFWRIGELDDENLVRWYRADRGKVDLTGERVKRIQDQPDIRMGCAPHNFPGVAMVVHMAAPSQSLVADAQVSLRRTLAELVKVGGSTVDATERHRR